VVSPCLYCMYVNYVVLCNGLVAFMFVCVCVCVANRVSRLDGRRLDG
jgi:hypothetical protein